MIFVLGLDMASIPIKEQTMETIISKIETAIDQVEPLRSRGDVKSICAALDSIKSLFKDISDSETRLQHFIIVWALREPPLIESYMHLLASNPSFSIQHLLDELEASTKKPKYEYLPKRLIGKHKPSALKKWDVADLSKSLTLKPNHKTLVKLAKKLPGVGAYSSEHFARTYYFAFNMPHPSSEFVVMGAGASKAKYDAMRKVGVNNIDELNQHLRAGCFINAGELSYYLCMGKVEF